MFYDRKLRYIKRQTKRKWGNETVNKHTNKSVWQKEKKKNLRYTLNVDEERQECPCKY